MSHVIIATMVVTQRCSYTLLISINSTDYMPDPILGAGDRAVSVTDRQADRHAHLRELKFSRR